jgi:hypothetical protein
MVTEKYELCISLSTKGNFTNMKLIKNKSLVLIASLTTILFSFNARAESKAEALEGECILKAGDRTLRTEIFSVNPFNPSQAMTFSVSDREGKLVHHQIWAKLLADGATASIGTGAAFGRIPGQAGLTLGYIAIVGDNHQLIICNGTVR